MAEVADDGQLPAAVVQHRVLFSQREYEAHQARVRADVGVARVAAAR